jgi:copper oxidase (laccase) domain-containing protein
MPGTLRWSLPGGVMVAYSTAADGDQRLPERRQAFADPLTGGLPLIVPRQVHGTLVVPHDTPDLSQADGVVGPATVALGAYGADCPGVVLVAPDALAIAHCGWRGTAGGMVARLAEALRQQTKTPATAWHALVGPGVSGPQYEVDAPVLSARAWPSAALRASAKPDRAHLDLATVLVADLHATGVTRVVRTDICTAADARLHSFRHQGPGLVQMLLVWRAAN